MTLRFDLDLEGSNGSRLASKLRIEIILISQASVPELVKGSDLRSDANRIMGSSPIAGILF